MRSLTTISLPPPNTPIVDYEVSIDGKWVHWQVSQIFVPTLDTVRQGSILSIILADHQSLVVCGPPGSGKTWTLLSALHALPNTKVVITHFSSFTTPEILLKTMLRHCNYSKESNDTELELALVERGKWIVFLCDEINLPDVKKVRHSASGLFLESNFLARPILASGRSCYFWWLI